MKKVLFGEHYTQETPVETQARLSAIQHEGWAIKMGRLPYNFADKGEGAIVTNSITGEIGLVCDTESEYHCLPEIHTNRLVDIVDGDGWNDTQGE